MHDRFIRALQVVADAQAAMEGRVRLAIDGVGAGLVEQQRALQHDVRAVDQLSVVPLNSNVPGPTFSNGSRRRYRAAGHGAVNIQRAARAAPRYVTALAVSSSTLPETVLLPLLLYKAPSPTVRAVGICAARAARGRADADAVAGQSDRIGDRQVAVNAAVESQLAPQVTNTLPVVEPRPVLLCTSMMPWLTVVVPL